MTKEKMHENKEVIEAEEIIEATDTGESKLPTHIKKGHQLVFSRQDLSAREADVFALMMAHMKPEDWQKSNPPSYTFSAAQLAKWLKIQTKHIGYTLEPIADRLAQKTIGIKKLNSDNDQDFEHTPIFKRIHYKNR